MDDDDRPTYRFIIDGAPRTKKNSLRRIKRGGRVFSVGSEAWTAWNDSAILQLRVQCRLKGLAPIATRVGVTALVFRDADRGDLINYLQATADALEAGGVLVDDVLIASWDGSRLRKDPAHPRVEVAVTVLSLKPAK